MLETIAYVVFAVLALGTLLLKGWALNGWPKTDSDDSEADGDDSETDGDARSDTELEYER